MKGYKVTDVHRTRIVGIACTCLQELKRKGCQKLNFADISEVHLQDGTVVDDEDYFLTLPNQTLFILRRMGENVVTGADIIYNELKSVNIDILRAYSETKQFFDKNVQHKIKILSRFIDKNQCNRDINRVGDVKQLTQCSRKDEHPAWFSDLDTNAKTKEEFMSKRCRGRIQGYFYNTRDSVRNSNWYKQNVKAKYHLDTALDNFWQWLKLANYFGYYFDRSNNKLLSLCDEYGNFDCHGVWNLPNCTYKFPDDHSINPYASREQRVLFGTWNLDHRIERSRTIIPALIEASKICTNKMQPCCKINSRYFYELLFTVKNLKLVHAVCHDKGQHKDAVCDPREYIISDDTELGRISGIKHVSLDTVGSKKESTPSKRRKDDEVVDGKINKIKNYGICKNVN